MKRRLFIGGVGLGLLILILAGVACSPNLQPQVDKLKADNAALTKQNQDVTNQVAALQKQSQDQKTAQATLEKQNQTLKDIAGPLPASLDNFFPPKAPAPVWLIELFNLAGPLEGIGVDLQEQDMAGVKTNYQAFKSQYDKVSGMVPEWKDRFPSAPVDALGQAVNAGDPSKIGPAMGQVGQVCGDCHLLYQVKAQQKYHWKNFDDIKVTDPLTNQSLKWGDYMTSMAGAYSGIATDLQEGQLDNARKNFQAFNTRLKTLAQDGCKQCHQDPTGKEIPRKYFVDADSMAMVDQLGKTLSANPPDSNAVRNLSGAIGNEICLKCHLVHLPAQNTKDRWEQYGDVLK